MASRLIVPSRIQPSTSPSDQDVHRVAGAVVADAREMLSLMQEVRGRIRGDVLIRRENSDSDEWQPSYCYTSVATGSLRYETASTESGFETLVPDLRGCKVYAHNDESSNLNTLCISFRNGGTSRLYLQPQNQKQFFTWFAAILCWSALDANENVADATEKQRSRPLSLLYPEVFTQPNQQNQDDENKIMKRNNVMMISTTTSGQVSEIAVACVLRRSCELSINDVRASTIIATVQVNQLPRSAIQRLNPSIYGRDRAFAIHPQYAHSANACSRLRPICLSFRSRDTYELWFALLRACAVPEMYGIVSRNRLALPDEYPRAYENPDFALLRIEHSLNLRINKAKLREASSGKHSEHGNSNHQEAYNRKFQMPGSYYAEIAINGTLVGKTAVKPDARGNVFWYENHSFQDLVRVPAAVSVKIRKETVHASSNHRNKRQTPATSAHDLSNVADQISCGESVIDLQALRSSQVHEQSLPLVHNRSVTTGELLLEIEWKRDNILMENEYDKVSALLHNLSNSLSTKIWKRIPSTLGKLAVLLLDIFQATGRANMWLKSLVEEEIKGDNKIQQGKNDSLFDSDEGENDRDDSKNRSSEVFILFRGNTLLSKALDTYMKRLGQHYLEETIGPIINDINEQDLDCEVDPTKLSPHGNISQNWENLFQTTRDFWLQIFGSVSRCPTELRMVFQHIQDCARDRYGDVIQSAVYTSVSGFLFLRFFCAAIYSPQLFGLVNGELKSNPRRTFVLVAKSLQGLANKQTDFSRKEPWMAPMNDFCSEYTQQFETFIDSICRITKDEALDEDNWAAAGVPVLDQVHQNLTHPTREGCLLLPGLVDPARSFAALVDLWIDTAKVDLEDDDVINDFDDNCREIRQKVEDYSENLDVAAKETGILQKWFNIAEQLESNPDQFWKSGQHLEYDILQLSSPSPAVPTGPNKEKHWSESKSESSRKNPKRTSSFGAPQTSPESKAASDRPASSRSSTGSGSYKTKRGKHPSPPRDAQDNALRKLGWM